MNIEQGLITYLLTDTDLMALVGNGDSPLTARIYPLLLPQDYTGPAMTYQRISGPRLHNLAGPAGRAMPRIQFDIYASTYSAAKNVADKLRAALDGHTGTMGTVKVGATTLDNDIDGYQSDVETYRISMDFIISHIES